MNNATGDDLDRTTSGRFVRNLALTLSGGALLTLLGASAAHAQDAAQAGTNSAGTGAAHSGDATAVGNQSGTNNTQTVTVSGNLGTIQVINQHANVSNTGVAVANTGGNIAIGNSSNNGATANQTAGGGTGSAVNNGQAANGSNGSATITTGNASAIGNSSNTSINQSAHGSAQGQLGGILVINQDATVTNSGVALANSGGNNATGNDSNNTAGLLQTDNTTGGLASNNGKATNDSDGKAVINTGNASATGNKSDTSITQSASGSAGGSLGGLVIINQNAGVLNSGEARANTGRNHAEGNESGNGANTEQHVGDPMSPVFNPVGVASNNGEASNTSGGTAGISTGNATAVGNESSTHVKQSANADVNGGGLTLVTQNSGVVNAGLAIANSGDNRATGNESDNTAGITQTAPAAGAVNVGVIGNFGLASNTSDGTGLINSGSASAAGNRSMTDVKQSATTSGGDFNLYTQGNVVANLGAGIATTGDNNSTGNDSESGASGTQTANLPASGVDVGVIGNFGKADNSSDGTAAITTGNASAVGNESRTWIGQTIDPNGLIIPTQTAAVVNAGVGIANTGDNEALGNGSSNSATESQTANIGSGNTAATTDIEAGTLVGSNNGEASNTSDGKAGISTGNASATGNSSGTAITQDSTGSVDGLGLVLNTQTAVVGNIGLGVANTGGNEATGNVSENQSGLKQTANVGANNGAGPTDITAGILTDTNSGTASNTSDGTAEIGTGDAKATGNRSATRLAQAQTASVNGLGAVINTQVGGVANIGVGVANSGLNEATGNDTDNRASLGQTASVGSGNSAATEVTAGTLTAANSGSADNTSDGTATIATGRADATGNTSSTDLFQRQDGNVEGLGLVLNTQVGGVLNAGVGIANSGGNEATGNESDNAGGTENNPLGSSLNQLAEIGSSNPAGAVTVTAFGPAVAANNGTASNTSDGKAHIRTGGAQAQGNVSTTALDQSQGGTIEKLGLAVNTQVGGVANVGLGVANSGLNEATGNESSNGSTAGQTARVGSNNSGTPVDITGLGSVTANNSGQATNTSDGTAKVGTGGALASGNVSATTVTQHQNSDVKDMGLIVGTQVGGVANVGVGIANSGLNEATGNESTNRSSATQDAEFASSNATPAVVAVVTVVGPLAANNSGQSTNTSDGEACVCTGNAVASGNISSTTLVQDLDLSVGSGAVVLTETGGVLNAGVGIANSGLNRAIGNESDNTATSTQTSTINNGLLTTPLVTTQVAHNGGGANNTSTGSGRVGSGNAKATGNESTTNFVQAAAVDSDFAVADLTGGTTNTGFGLANSGLNLGIGNDSTNTAVLDQTADGAGIVANDGTADNTSAGSATINNPNCDVPVTPGTTTPGKPGTPGAASLPRTGGPIEAEAMFGLMLLLAGFGLRRKGNSLT